MSQIFEFLVDEKKFTLTRKTLIKYQDSLISKTAFSREFNDRVFVMDSFGKTQVFIDADPDSFKHIVSFMRGYPINLNLLDSATKSKLRYDAEYFQIKDIIDQFEEVQNEQNQLFETSSDESELLEGGVFMENPRIATEKAIENIKTLFSKLKEQADSETGNTLQMEELINTIQEKLNTSDSHLITAMSTDPSVIEAVKRYQEGLMKDDSDSDGIGDFELTITDDEKQPININIIDLLSKSKKHKNRSY